MSTMREIKALIPINNYQLTNQDSRLKDMFDKIDTLSPEDQNKCLKIVVGYLAVQNWNFEAMSQELSTKVTSYNLESAKTLEQTIRTADGALETLKEADESGQKVVSLAQNLIDTAQASNQMTNQTIKLAERSFKSLIDTLQKSTAMLKEELNKSKATDEESKSIGSKARGLNRRVITMLTPVFFFLFIYWVVHFKEKLSFSWNKAPVFLS